MSDLVGEGESSSSSYDILPPVLSSLRGAHYDQLPLEVAHSRETQDFALAPTAGGAWRAEVDQESGSTYYVNVATNESQWTKPPELVASSACHSNTQEASSSDMIGQVKTSALSHRTQTAPTLIPAKRAWLSLVDDASGCTYYVDQSTGMSQWEKPPDMQPAPQDQVTVAIDRQDGNASSLQGALELPKDNITLTRSQDDNSGTAELQVERYSVDPRVNDSDRDKEEVSHALGSTFDNTSSLSPGAFATADESAFATAGEPSIGALQVDPVKPGLSYGARPYNGERQKVSADSPGTAFTAWRSPNMPDGALEGFNVSNIAQTDIDQTTMADVKRTETDRCHEQQGTEDDQALLPSGQSDVDTGVQKRTQRNDFIVACNDRSFEPMLGVSIDFDPAWGGGAPSDNEHSADGGGNLETPLSRADSSSTLSTYCAGLDSLAQYVTGYSSTLKTGVDPFPSRESQDGESLALEKTANTPVDPIAADLHTPSGRTASVPPPLDQDNGEVRQKLANVEMKHSTENNGVVPTSSVTRGGKFIDLPNYPALHGSPAVVGESAPSDLSERNDVNEIKILTSSPGKQDNSQARSALVHLKVPAYENQGIPLQHKNVGPSAAVVNQTRLQQVVPSGVEKDPITCEDGFLEPGIDTSEQIASPLNDTCAKNIRPVTPVAMPCRDAETDGLVKSNLGEISGRRRVTTEIVDPLPAENALQSMIPMVQDSPDGRRTIEESRIKIPVLLSSGNDGTTVNKTATFESQGGAVAAVQKHLEEGMLLRRQQLAMVVIQARVRGFAARRRYIMHLARLESRHREEHEAKRRAATAIQAIARGHAGRRERDRRKHEPRTIKDDRSVFLSLGQVIPRDNTAYPELPFEENVLQPPPGYEASDIQGTDPRRLERFSECSDDGTPKKHVPSAASSKGTGSASSFSDDGPSNREEVSSSSSEGTNPRSPTVDTESSIDAERRVESVASSRQDAGMDRFTTSDLLSDETSKGTSSASSSSGDGPRHKEEVPSSSSGVSRRSPCIDTKDSTHTEHSIESIRSTRQDSRSDAEQQQARYSKSNLQSDAKSRGIESTSSSTAEEIHTLKKQNASSTSESCKTTAENISLGEASMENASNGYSSSACSESSFMTHTGTSAAPSASLSRTDMRTADDHGIEFRESLRQADQHEASTQDAPPLGSGNAAPYSQAGFWTEDSLHPFHNGLCNNFLAPEQSRAVEMIREAEMTVRGDGSHVPSQISVHGEALETITPPREEQHKSENGMQSTSRSYLEGAEISITPGDKLEELPNCTAPGCRVDLGSNKNEESTHVRHIPSNTESTLPMDKLEGIRHLVATQAEVTARMSMIAVGTDTSRREAARMRELMSSQQKAASSFREAIRRSVAVDCESKEISRALLRGSSPPPSTRCSGSNIRWDHGIPRAIIERENIHGPCAQGNDKEQPEVDDKWSQLGENRDGDIDTVTAACVLTSDLGRLASRQSDDVRQVFGYTNSTINEPVRGDLGEILEVVATLGQSVGLQARAVGLLEEVVMMTKRSRIDAMLMACAARKAEKGRLAETLAENVKVVAAEHHHVARKMEAASDPFTARNVAEGIRHLNVIQEDLSYKIGQFVASADAMENGSEREKDGRESMWAGSKIAASTDAKVIATGRESGGEWAPEAERKPDKIQDFAAIVMHQLKKGIDIGSIAVERAHGIRRESQAVKLADELRCIASSQANAAAAMAQAGAQLVDEALAEVEDFPMASLPPSSNVNDTVPGAETEDTCKRVPYAAIAETPAARFAAELQPDAECTSSSKSDRETVGFRNGAVSNATVTTVAAGEEEQRATKRLKAFLIRRWREREAVPSAVRKCILGAESEPETKMAEPRNGGKVRWLGSAIRSLRQAVDDFLREDTYPQCAQSADPPMVESSTGNSPLCGLEVTTAEHDGDSDTASTSQSERGNESSALGVDEKDCDEEEDDLPPFPPLPFRAMAPSQYTLPLPGILQKRVLHGGRAIIDNTCETETISPRQLDVDISSRLSSARSVFGLRATDVLSAFSLCPPRKNIVTQWQSVTPAAGDWSTACKASGYRTTSSSPDVLRRRLQSEAHHVAHAGLRQPWDSLPRGRPASPSRRRPRSASPVRSPPYNGTVGNKCDHVERWRSRCFGGPVTAVGRHFLEKRAQVARDARRKTILGVTDAARFKHAGRQLRCEAAVNALEKMLLSLNSRACIGRERHELPEAHVERLLDMVDRLAFSSSQLRQRLGTQWTSQVSERQNALGDAEDTQQSRCPFCKELMQDLREKFAVVREQSSWEDTDPFYCGQCQSLHNPTSPPYNTIPVDPENRGEDRVSTPSPPQGTWEENLGNSPQDHLEQTGCSDSCCLAGPAMGETTGKIASLPVESRGHGKVRLDDAMVTGRETRRPSPPSVAIAAEISTHLHKVDKYPLDCARLCRFAQFLTDNGLLGEAYEVILHTMASFTFSANSNECRDTSEQFPSSMPPNLGAQLSLVAGFLAVAVGRYTEAVRHVKQAARAATIDNSPESPAILVASSRMFEDLKDDKSAEILLLGSLVLSPNCVPALLRYGRLAARKGELDVAERYLARAVSLATSTTKEGTGKEEVVVHSWVALMEFLQKKRPASRAADARNCFKKALMFLNWTTTGGVSTPALTRGVSTVDSPTASSAVTTSPRPSASDMLALGRFELLTDRNIERATALFRACVEINHWHASGKLHLACCLLVQLAPLRRLDHATVDRSSPRLRSQQRETAKIDEILRSVLEARPYPLAPSSSRTSTNPPQHTAPLVVDTFARTTSIQTSSRMPCTWFVWTLYAKFAEICLRNGPSVALNALQQAEFLWSRKASVRRWGGRECGGSIILIARAQLCQRCPQLIDSREERNQRVTLEGMFVDATLRYPNDVATHTALGFFLLSKDGDSIEQNATTCERAVNVFRRARAVSKGGEKFVPAMRGLAVTHRRRLLMGRGMTSMRPENGSDPDSAQEQHDENDPCNLVQKAIKRSIMPGGKGSISLMRTAAMHIYAWRSSMVSGRSPHLLSMSTTLKSRAAAAVTRVAGALQAEGLLTKAVDLEPFHWPTMVALAFLVLQRGGVDTVSRAGALLERAVKLAGRDCSSDVLRALALIRASQDRQSVAVSLLHRATVADTRTATDVTNRYRCSNRGEDPLSLCHLGRLLITPRRRRRHPTCALQPTSSDGRASSCSAGPETKTGVLAAAPNKEEFKLPSVKDKDEARRLFLRALASAKDRREYFVNNVPRKKEVDGDGDGVRRRSITGESEVMDGVLAQVHLEVSEYSQLLGSAGLDKDSGARGVGDVDCDKVAERHLREAAKASPDTKIGLTARYVLAKRILAGGDDKRAELLFLEALDAEPTTLGACAAFLSMLRQVSADVANAKSLLGRLRRRVNKGKRRQAKYQDGTAKKLTYANRSQRLEVAQRSYKLLERLETYAALRKRFTDDRLRGPGLGSLEWAIALEEGWEMRYTYALEGGDGWAALHLLR